MNLRSALFGALAAGLTHTLILCALPTITDQREDAPALRLVPAAPERKV